MLMRSRVRWTILYGLFGALFFGLGYGLLSQLISPFPAFISCVWCVLVGYELLLTRWANVPIRLIVFPVMLPFLLMILFPAGNFAGFFILQLLLFSWARSCACFHKHVFISLATELVLSLGAGSLVLYFAPASPFSHGFTLTWSLGLWLFFLAQSLFFIVPNTKTAPHKQSTDPFEKARKKAEEILMHSTR